MTDQSLLPELRAALLAAVEAGFEAQLQATEALTAIPSLRFAESPAQDFMAAQMRARGMDVDRFRLKPEDLRHLPGYSPTSGDYSNAWTVVGAHRAPVVTGRSLIINGHVDVVPTGPADMWETPPFTPRRADGWLYGRGSGDMKAGLIAGLAALDAIRAAGYMPAADVFVQSVIDEECTGLGTLSCLHRGYQADAVLIPEPLQEQLVTAQVGVTWFQVTLRGKPLHVRDTESDTNAILAAYDVVNSLRRLEKRWNALRMEDPDFAGIERAIALNIGRIEGGDWASSVPAWCRFHARIATFPGQDQARARDEIRAAVQEAAADNAFLRLNPPEVMFEGFQAEGFRLAQDASPRVAFARAHHSVTGNAPQNVATTATTDARFYALYANTPSLVFGPLAEGIHGTDERVNLASLKRVTAIVALFIADWCGVKSISGGDER